MSTKLKFGWVKDAPDHRDVVYSAPLGMLKSLPKKIDLRDGLDAPYDQGRIGSCTANAIAAAIQFDRRKMNQSPDFVPSRLFIYYNERAMEKTVAIDNGAQIRDGVKSINRLGVCPEAMWSYSDTPANEHNNVFPSGAKAVEKPPSSVYDQAAKHTLMSYSRISRSLSQFKGCLASGYPFVFGFTVFQSIYGADGQPLAHVPMPSENDENIGGHAVLAIGYDDASHSFLIRNSWGPNVQDHGHFWMPYAYLLDSNLSSDFWTLRAMTS